MSLNLNPMNLSNAPTTPYQQPNTVANTSLPGTDAMSGGVGDDVLEVEDQPIAKYTQPGTSPASGLE